MACVLLVLVVVVLVDVENRGDARAFRVYPWGIYRDTRHPGS